MAKDKASYPVREIAIKDIDRSRNYRMKESDDAARIEALAESIKVAGQLQDVRVYERGPDQKDAKRKEPYILGFGGRRCEALLLIGMSTVRAVVYPAATDAEIEQARAVENLHRKDISPLEEVQAVANLLDALKRDKAFAGDPYEEAATRLARSVTWVKDRDYLHRLTKPVREFVARAGLPAGHLREIAKVGDPQEQLRLACEAAGAQASPFDAADDDGDNAAAREARQEYFKKLADGGVQRWTLSRLKQKVELLKRSLKVVPWEYAEPVEHGDVTLRACAGCPHNSETDRTLFGVEAEADNPRGYCLDISCFEAKRAAVEAAKAAVYKKIARRRDQTPTAIKRAAPSWIKDTSVVGHVQRELKKAAENTEVPKAKTPARDHQGGRKLTDHEEAVVKFAEALEKWYRKSFDAVLKGINADPVYRVGWCLLAGTEAYHRQDNWKIPYIDRHANEPCTDDPTLPPLPNKIAQAIELAMKGTRAAWIELAGWNKQGDPDYREQVGPIHTDALLLLAERVGVKLSKTPEWKAPVPADATESATKA